MESTRSDRVVVASDGTILFFCPGCRDVHAVWQKDKPNPATGAVWTFNGNKQRPTFSPSVLVLGYIEAGRNMIPRCHSFVENGQIRFLSDCEHDLAGKTVDLPENPLMCE